MRLNLTQGDHEGRVEQTQICPVRVVHYSPGSEREQQTLSEPITTATSGIKGPLL